MPMLLDNTSKLYEEFIRSWYKYEIKIGKRSLMLCDLDIVVLVFGVPAGVCLWICAPSLAGHGLI